MRFYNSTDDAIERREERNRRSRESRKEELLRKALDWLDDYGMRMAGTAKLADKIRAELATTDSANTH